MKLPELLIAGGLLAGGFFTQCEIHEQQQLNQVIENRLDILESWPVTVHCVDDPKKDQAAMDTAVAEAKNRTPWHILQGDGECDFQTHHNICNAEIDYDPTNADSRWLFRRLCFDNGIRLREHKP